MKVVFIFLIGILAIAGSISRGRAAGSVNMNVTVVERKVTDTINDFDFSSLSTNVQPQILGAATEKKYCLKGETDTKKTIFWMRLKDIFSF